MCIALIGLVGLPTPARAAPRSGGIPWAKDLAEARELAKKTGRPIIVYWTGAAVHEGRKGTRKRTPEQYLERVRTELFPKLETNPRTQQFVWLKIDFNDDADAVKAFRIDEHWAHFARVVTWPAPSGFVFASAEGKIYGRFAGRPIAPAFDDMMEGVLKAHSPPGSRVRAIPYDTKIRYKPYSSRRRSGPPKITPHAETWRECSTCSEALGKAMPFLKKYPRLGWMSSFFAGFAYMMADGCEEELARCVAKARHAARPHWGGYSNWEISSSMLLIAEYSLRYGLTPENREVLVKAQQYASENVDDGGGWFHHAKHGGANYAWDISMIGTLFFAALLEMEALGLEAQPALTLGRGYLERLSVGSGGYAFGYGTPFRGGGVGSVGKNGFVIMGFHGGGQPDDPHCKLLGDFLNDYPEGPPRGHASGWHHFFGAGVGAHRRGPESYARYAGYWLHAIIDCQKEDGSIAPFPHDNGANVPPEEILAGVKSSGNHNVAATAILTSLILMTEPGVFSGLARKKPGSLPNKRAYELGSKALKEGSYGKAYRYFGEVLPPGKDLELVPVARKKKAEIKQISLTKLVELTDKEAALRKRVEDEGSSVDIVVAWQKLIEAYGQYAKDFEGLLPVRDALKRRGEMRKRSLGLRLRASARGRRRNSASSRQGSTSSGAKSSGSAPAPVAAGMPDAAVQATWEEKLQDRAGARFKSGVRIRFEVKRLRARVTISRITDEGLTVRMSNGGQIDMKWSQFNAADKRSLAAGLAATEPASEDHALAAFYYLLDGNGDKARDHLTRAGKHAADVRAAFGQ